MKIHYYLTNLLDTYATIATLVDIFFTKFTSLITIFIGFILSKHFLQVLKQVKVI